MQSSPFHRQPGAAELYTPGTFAAQAQQFLRDAQSRFGRDRFRMEDPPEGGDDAAAQAAAAAKVEADAAAKAAEDAKAAAGKEKIEDQPPWVQKMVKDLRSEAASARTTAKKTAAEEASAETLTKVLEALGVKAGGKAPTLEEVQQELEKTKSDAGSKDGALREKTVELAVYRTASKAGGDADSLLDSRGFLTKIKDLDPEHKDFSDKLAAAIKEAVKDNPKLRASQAGAGSSSADHGSGGSGEGGTRTPKSLTDAVSGHYGT